MGGDGIGKHWAYVIAAVVILMGLSVVITESGLLAYLPANWWMRLLRPLGWILFAAAGFLSWRHYRLTNEVFFKLLAVSFFIIIGMALLSVLSGSIRHQFVEPGKLEVLRIVQVSSTVLQQAGAFLAAFFLMHAVGNYKGYQQPVRRGLLIAMMMYIVLNAIWQAGTLLVMKHPHSVDYVFFMSTESILLTVIYLTGIKTALEIIRATGSRLLKWLTAAMSMQIFVSLAWVFPWVIFRGDFGAVFAGFYNYAIILVSALIPALYVAALATCGKECCDDAGA